MKKTILLLAGLLSLSLPVVIQAQSYTNSYGVWNYTATNGMITINSFQGYGSSSTGSNSTVTVPSVINGLPVTAIGQQAFYGDYMTLTGLTIPNSVTSIGTFAFAECTYLTNTLLGTGITNIGNSAFQGDNSLKGAYFLGNAPSYGTNYDPFVQDNNCTIYYLQSNAGWSNTFAGRPAVPWNPIMPPLGISTYSNHPVLFFAMPASFPTSVGSNYSVQMTTNLASGNWVTITNYVSLICVQITNAPSPAFFRLQP
jgi:BspA type Leucine rich repeat region (6 copies)